MDQGAIPRSPPLPTNSPASRSSRLARNVVGMPGLAIGAILMTTAFGPKELFIESPSPEL